MQKNRPHLSRRSFLTTAASACGGILLAPSWRNAAAQAADPRIAQVLSRAIGIDMHNHVYPTGTDPNAQPTSPGIPQPAPAHELFIADQIKKSGLTAVCASYVLDHIPNARPGDAHNTYLHWLDTIDAQLQKGHIRRALNLKDLQAAHASGQPTIVQTVEGAMFIEGHIERVAEVYRRGLRNLQLLHEHDDIVSPLGDTNIGPAHLGGLTTFGAEVIRECNRLGILVDLAHASHETVLGALKITTQPIIISHTSLDSRVIADTQMAERMKPRLISKEHAKVVADAGGVVGVWTKLADSLQEFVQSIRSMVDAIGVDHVGIGTDDDLLSARVGQGLNQAYPNMPAAFFPSVVGEMLHQGFTPDEISKVGGGNYCRVFGKVTSGHA